MAVTAGKTVPANRRERAMAEEVAGKSPESVQTDRLAARLARDMTGDVLFDGFGRCATEASRQIVPTFNDPPAPYPQEFHGRA